MIERSNLVTGLVVVVTLMSLSFATDLFTLDDGTALVMTVTDTGQVAVGVAPPAASAALDVQSVTRGLLPPRMTEAQRDAIASPAAGLQIYNTDTDTMDFYDGGAAAWVSMGNLPPLLTAGTVNATTLTLTYTAVNGLDTGAVPAIGDFLVGSSGAAQAVTAVALSSTAVMLTLAPGVAGGDVVTVTYTPGGNKIQDAGSSKPARALTGQALTNTTPLIVDTWATRKVMPTARWEPGACAINGKLYVFGGYDGSSPLATVEEYDPVLDTWSTRTSMPTARSSLEACAVNGKVYCIGGKGAAELATVEEYDPVTDTWATKASMPTARREFAVAVVAGKVYAIGGTPNGSTNIATLEEYDVAANTWATKAPMPTARRHIAAAAVNGRVYALAGYTSTDSDLVEEYNPADDTWVTKPSVVPTARYTPIAEAVNGKIYVIGGYRSSGGGQQTVNQEYNPATDTWATKAPMSVPRVYSGSGVINNKIYVVGGINVGGENANEEYTP